MTLSEVITIEEGLACEGRTVWWVARNPGRRCVLSRPDMFRSFGAEELCCGGVGMRFAQQGRATCQRGAELSGEAAPREARVGVSPAVKAWLLSCGRRKGIEKAGWAACRLRGLGEGWGSRGKWKEA